MQKDKDGHLVEYIGDGVYATFDGYGVWLKCNGLNNGLNKVYLEREVVEALNSFIERVGGR